MAVVRKKQDDKYLLALRELVTTGGGNRQCFDCGQKGPTYVNMTIGSFVCTRCSGVLRGLTPPHRVKSISMATFTQNEIDFLKMHGNDLSAKTWLGLWDPKRVIHQDHRELMIDKYERKRYYLEPASPLKSLTNVGNLKSNTTTAGTTTAASTTAATTQSTHSNGNSHSHTNGYASIQLTPPTSQRTTANGLHKSSSTAINRPQQQNGYHHHQHHHQQQQQHHQDAFTVNNNNNSNNNNNHSLMNGGLSSLNSAGSTSTGALSDTSSCASNGFGPDADFVADFGSANIFDATSAGSVGSPAVSSASSVASTNGYAKIQPIKAAHQQQQQFMNGNATKSNNNSNKKRQQFGGVATSSNVIVNGSATNTENFADFDHAPIYNAAGLPMANGVNNKNGSTSANAFNNNHNNKTPAEDRYAALKDLDEQLRESKAIAATAAYIVSNNVVDSFNNAANNNNNNTNPNPFKAQQQLQQQQQQQQNGTMINPFQAAGLAQNNNTQNLYGQMSLATNGIGTNGYGTSPQQMHLQQQQHQPTQQPQAFFNYSNGYAVTSNGVGGGVGGNGANMFAPTMTTGMPNGCGFGFGSMQQQIGVANGGGMNAGAFNNPFAATGTMNSNNPFL